MAAPSAAFFSALDCFAGFCSLLLFSFVCPCSTCMCHLTFKQGQTLEQKHQKLYNPHGSALRASLLFSLLRTQERNSHCLSGEKTKKQRNMRSATPQVNSHLSDIYSHIGPALSITHQRTPQVSGEGHEAHAKSIGVWTFTKHCELNRCQRCGNGTID